MIMIKIEMLIFTKFRIQIIITKPSFNQRLNINLQFHYKLYLILDFIQIAVYNKDSHV